MRCSKADFKARCEVLGLAQADIADAFGVARETVKRWERPGFPEPPADAWLWIESCEDAQREAVEKLVSDAIASGREDVQISYYLNKEQYDQFGYGFGSFSMSNANARMVATRLQPFDISVDFVYPDNDESQ